MTAFPSHQPKRFGSGEEPRQRIMHVDMDAYFAALEQRANPHLKGRPVVVGSTGITRGVVSTASYETRAYGVRSGMPIAEARQRCPQAVYLGVDGDHYVTVSAELLKIFQEFSPRVEQVSVDEAFLDVAGCERVFKGEEELARQLKSRIVEMLSLTCSVGIAPTKTLAKLASSVFKPDGLTVIRQEDIESVLHPLRVGNLWGIGPVAEEALTRMGIKTIGDLANADLSTVKRRLGQNGEMMVRLARGEDQTPVLPPDEQPDEKSIGHERTLPNDVTDLGYLHATLHHLADLVSRRLRRNGFCGKTIVLKLRFSDFTTLTRRVTQSIPTDRHADIYSQALALFGRHHDRRRAVRLLGISMTQLVRRSSDLDQADLFAQKAEGSQTKVDLVMDAIRDKFGDGIIQGALSHLGADY